MSLAKTRDGRKKKEKKKILELPRYVAGIMCLYVKLDLNLTAAEIKLVK